MQRVGPVLDPDPCLIKRVNRVGDVACGVDVGIVGPQRGVDENTIVDGRTGLLGEFGVGSGAHSDDDHVRRDLVAVIGDHRRDLPAAPEPGHRGAKLDVDGLQPDPTGTHDDDPAATADRLAQPLGIVDPAQVIDAIQVRTPVDLVGARTRQ